MYDFVTVVLPSSSTAGTIDSIDTRFATFLHPLHQTQTGPQSDIRTTSMNQIHSGCGLGLDGICADRASGPQWSALKWSGMWIGIHDPKTFSW
jgi:hypothetical protein